MPSDSDTLVGMGFSAAKVARAMKATKNAGLQPAMDWLFAHADDPDDMPLTEDDVATSEQDNGEITADQATAASLKCDDCGRLLRDATAAEGHAVKTGHQNFSESTESVKPLTEEEKKQKLQQLHQKLAARKEEKRLQEIEEEKNKEKVRRKTGQEIVELQEKHKELEMKKALEEKKREKEADKIAKEQIKRQIEQDKRDRAARMEKERLERQGLSSPAAIPKSNVVAANSSTTKNYSEARIQFRLSSGGVLTQTFGASETLSTVAAYLSAQTGKPQSAFKIMTTFPRKVLDDMSASLKDLQLVPSAALAVQITE